MLAADIHILSLCPGWEGIAVPSKFFGSLAVGKPVLYAGPEKSSIANWIREYNVGLVLTETNMKSIAERLLELAENPDGLKTWQENAINAYEKYFSKKVVMDAWNSVLRDTMNKH